MPDIRLVNILYDPRLREILDQIELALSEIEVMAFKIAELPNSARSKEPKNSKNCILLLILSIFLILLQFSSSLPPSSLCF